MLHGAYGEDGTIQGLLEMADIPYVGAGVLASAVAMDKEYAKKLLAAEGLPSGPYAVLRPHEKTLSESERERLGLSAFVKPARGGSSIGISRITDWSELETAIATARAVDPKVLVEAAIIGREIECGVLEGEDGGPPEASLPSEIRVVGSRQGWYDFDTKYLDDATEFDIPPNLPADLIAEIRETACVPGVHRAGRRRARAGRLLPHFRERADRQRDQHTARLHADLAVPEDVGSHRPPVSGAGRPPGPYGPSPRHRPALTG